MRQLTKCFRPSLSTKTDKKKRGKKKINLPKKGTERPTSSVETTRAVLMSLEYMKKLGLLAGINSSRHIATGDRLNAYVGAN